MGRAHRPERHRTHFGWVSLTVDPSYIDSCLLAVQELVSANKIRLDYKPLFWSVKDGRVVPPSDIEIKEEYKRSYFVYFSSAELGVTESIKAEQSKLAMTYPGLTFVAQVEQPWHLAGVKVSYSDAGACSAP